MPRTVTITEAIQSLREARQTFGFRSDRDANWFSEWWRDRLEISDSEKQTLDLLKERYFYYADDNAITEGTLNIILISPLLELANLCNLPFKIRSEQAVKITLEESDIVLQGFIDALVIKEQFWIVVIEAKRYGFNVSMALPQAITYMMTNPQPEKEVFGFATNGEDYVFIKLNQHDRKYALSRKFSLSNPTQNELYEVFQTIQQIKNKFA